MAAIWRLHSYWRENGHCNVKDPHVVHLHFIFNHGIAIDHLYGPGVLDEYQTIYPFCKT